MVSQSLFLVPGLYANAFGGHFSAIELRMSRKQTFNRFLDACSVWTQLLTLASTKFNTIHVDFAVWTNCSESTVLTYGPESETPKVSAYGRPQVVLETTSD